MNTGNRINIKQKDVNRAVTETDHNVTVKVMLSLFDVPQSTYADFDKEKRIMRLVFDYLGDDEPTVERPTDGAVSLLLGKFSERLYKVEIALDELPQINALTTNYDLVIDIVEKGMNHYKEKNPRIRSRSFEAVDRVLKQYSSELKPLVQRALVAP
ncbi:hypothetical protein [Rhodospirillaceae bacterium SYSU D60014]|uniref:hypothetical protein n=1 Tax=Virgifigura deserti TaxID=2268457 RepID=UPI000E66F2BC